LDGSFSYRFVSCHKPSRGHFLSPTIFFSL
jgi:hypothetical protein